MKKLFVYLLLGIVLNIFCTSSQSEAFQIVYPKSRTSATTSDKIFFIGNESPSKKLFINNSEVPIHSSGGFIYTVNLNIGNNEFVIKNSEKSAIYRIIRKEKKEPNKDAGVNYFKNSIIVETISNNTPLRVTPQNFGANRLQHLEKNICLEAIGEYNDFYKVKLARDDYAWVSKDLVKKCNIDKIEPANISSVTFEKTSNSRIYRYKLDQKVPYVLFDNKGLDLTIYNVNGFPFNKYEYRINNIPTNTGFNSYYTSDNELVIETKNIKVSKNVLNGVKITLDPGHGGEEYGAIGCLGNPEKDVNLQIALKLKDKLIQKGAKVFMTRESDDYVSLNDRVTFANKNSSDVFLSIHNNAVADNKASNDITGTETYYFYPQSKNLAKSLQDSITKGLASKDLGVKQESFAVVRNSQCLAVLLEIGFMIAPDDNAKLLDNDYQDKITNSIVEGLEKYFADTKF